MTTAAMSEHEHSTGHRLVRAEHQLTDLQSEMAGIKADVSNVRQDILSLHDAIKEIGNTLQSRSHTNWGVLLTGSGVLLSLVVYYNSLVLSPINERLSVHRNELTEMTSRWKKHEYELGRDQERIKSMRAQIKELRTGGISVCAKP